MPTNYLPSFLTPDWHQSAVTDWNGISEHDCTFTSASASKYIYLTYDWQDLAGKTIIIGADTFTSSTSNARLLVRLYPNPESPSDYTVVVDDTNYVSGTTHQIEVPAVYDAIRIYFRHTGSSTSNLTLGGAGIYDVSEIEDQTAPTDLVSIKTTTMISSDGEINGTTTDMEYRVSTSATYTACTGASITGLSAGTYYVRKKARIGYNASPDTEVVVHPYKTNLLPLFTDPGWVKNGLAATTFTASADGKSCSFQVAAATDYIYYPPLNDSVIGKSLKIYAGTFNTSDSAAWLNVRSYNAVGSYTSPVHRPGNYTPGTEIAFSILATQSYARVFFMHTTKYTGVATVNVGNVYLYDVNEPESGSQAAPTGLTGTAPSVYGAADGSISGTSTAMEYRISTSETYTPCTGTSITGLVAGTYYVRMAAAGGLTASADTSVTIANGPLQSQTAPTGLTSTACTRQGSATGIISGVDATMEYRNSTIVTYTKVTDTTISGLVAGTYYVRYSAKTGYMASPDTEVIVEDGPPVDYTKYTNVLPLANGWTAEGILTNVAFANGHSITYDTPNYSSYYYCKISNVADLIGHPIEIGAESFSVSNPSSNTMFRVSITNTSNVTTNAIALGAGQFVNGYHYTFTIPADTSAVRIYFRQSGDYPSTISVSNAFMYNMDEDITPEEPTQGYPLGFQKLLEENMPASIDAGTERIIFTQHGLSAHMHITDTDGVIHPVKLNTRSVSDHSYAVSQPGQYCQAFIDAKKDLILQLQRAGDTFTFTQISDIHLRQDDQVGGTSRVNQLRDAVMLTNQIHIDYIAMTGDILAATENRLNTKWRLKQIMNILKDAGCPTYITRGNHDFCTDWYGGNAPMGLDNLVSNQMWYECVERHMEHRNVHFQPGYEGLGYFYVDMPNIKHRAIFVTSYEYWDDENGYPMLPRDDYLPGSSEIAGVCSTLQQFQWLMSDAFHMEGKPGWSISFYSHQIPYTDRGTSSYEFHHYGGDAPEFREVVKYLQNGTATTGYFPCMDRRDGSWITVPYNTSYFATQGPIPIVGFFAGHIHDDCYKKVDGLNCCVITSSCSDQRKNWRGQDDNPTKIGPPRNKSSLAMSMNVYIVNQTNRTVNMVKVGSERAGGSDYSFTF